MSDLKPYAAHGRRGRPSTGTHCRECGAALFSCFAGVVCSSGNPKDFVGPSAVSLENSKIQLDGLTGFKTLQDLPLIHL